MMTLTIKQLDHATDLPLPAYATEGASGLDLRAAIKDTSVIEPGERMLLPTGLMTQIPSGYEGQIRSRSGLALKEGLIVLNSPGTIDSDYRGELHVLMINMGQAPATIERGMRIAQLVIAPVIHVRIVSVRSMEETVRGVGAFGSTGVL
jgi:dUTP pyrophosphatase